VKQIGTVALRTSYETGIVEKMAKGAPVLCQAQHTNGKCGVALNS